MSSFTSSILSAPQVFVADANVEWDGGWPNLLFMPHLLDINTWI